MHTYAVYVKDNNEVKTVPWTNWAVLNTIGAALERAEGLSKIFDEVEIHIIDLGNITVPVSTFFKAYTKKSTV